MLVHAQKCRPHLRLPQFLLPHQQRLAEGPHFVLQARPLLLLPCQVPLCLRVQCLQLLQLLGQLGLTALAAGLCCCKLLL
jgi:hypothetical protein